MITAMRTQNTYQRMGGRRRGKVKGKENSLQGLSTVTRKKGEEMRLKKMM